MRSADELARAQRYFSKSYNQGTTPGTIVVAGAESAVASNSLNGEIATVTFPVVMLTTPSVTQYSTANGGSAVVYDVSASSNVSGVPGNVSDRGYPQPLSIGATDGHLYFWHWVAVADL